MNIIERLIRVVAPHSCIGCALEADRLLCEGCVQSMTTVPSRCYKCSAVTDGYAVCKRCRPMTPLRQVVVLTHYQGLAKELVHRMKYERARQGASEIAALLESEAALFPADAVLVPIPTATSRVRTRGYDHARLIAQALAAQKRPVGTLLARVGQAHQVGAQRAARLRQLERAFRPVQHAAICGKHIVLVDDVLTTGATLETAARALKRAGARRVDAIVFAQA